MKNDDYQQRKEKSNAMLSNGFRPIKNGFNEYFIPSQSDNNKKYKVTINKGWYSCQCPDNAEAKNLCKHIIFLKTFFAMTLSAREQPKITASNPCPHCDSLNLQKFGTRKTIMGLKQRWLCNDCGKRFVNQPVSKIKGNSDTVITSIDLYMKGVSYRGIADSIKQFYGLKVTHVTIMNWVNDYMQRINEYVNQMKPQQIGDVWHADEQFIKVKGKQEYVWNVLDSDTRFLLASNETKTRENANARETFQIAKKIAGKKAKTVITDGAFGYENAVRKEFATYKNPKPHYRYVSMRAKDVSNNRIERFHETFRQRDKTMRNFQTNQKQYAENFKTYYNFVRQHQGLKQTPAQKAGLEVKPEWKDLLEKATRQVTTPNLPPKN